MKARGSMKNITVLPISLASDFESVAWIVMHGLGPGGDVATKVKVAGFIP